MASNGRSPPHQRPTAAAGDPHRPPPPSYPPSSRGSSNIVPIPMMPPIAEDDDISRTSSHSSSQVPTVIWPRTPLRVPQKSPRRAIARAQAAAARAAAATGTGTSNAPPPYVPVTQSPSYREYGKSRSESDESDEALRAKEAAAGRAYQEEGPPEDEKKLFGLGNRQWHGSRRKRYCLFFLVGLLLIGLIVGLAVGLTLGLKKGNGGSDSDKDKSSDDSSSTPVFPAGSYRFETTFQRSSTACTSRASTWRCYPYTTGSNATFFWIIDRAPTDNSSFTVSSSENPFAPSFRNLTTSILDAGHDDERIVFSFDMDKDVVPSDALTAQNRAAKCTYGDTKFQATLWTKRGGGADQADPSQRFGSWPGDVEIMQTKSYEQGEPKCVDGDGNQIADVQGAQGDCTCDYANFDLN